MYGEEKLNSHYILIYGLTKEFYDGYKQLRFKNIEIPTTLTLHFYAFIKPWVLENRVKSKSVQPMIKKHQMQTTKDAQIALSRYPSIKQNLAKHPERKAILMHVKLIDFALDKLRDSPVILIVPSARDEIYLESRIIPEHFLVIKISDEFKQSKLSANTYANLREVINMKSKLYKKHPIFGSTDFNKWLITRAIHSSKMIKLLDTLIRKHPIGLIMDHSELANPGNTLSLLAKKYNLPFISIPQVLVNDFSFLPTRASYYFVWGAHMRNWIVKRGISPKRIKITGNLKFKYSFDNSRIRKERSYWEKLIGVTTRPKHIVTYLTQTYDDVVTKNVMNWISRAAKKLPHIHFLIKPHPSDHTNYAPYTRAHNIRQIPQDSDLYHILYHSDLVMTISSNTAIEAAMLNKATIVLQPKIPYHFEKNNNDYSAHLVHANAGPVAKNHSELILHLEKYFTHASFQKHVLSQAQQFLKKSLKTSFNPADEAYKQIQRILRTFR